MMFDIYDGLNFVRTRLETGGSTVGQLYHQHAPPTYGKVSIWVWDGKGGNDRRRAIFPEYKAKRKPASDDMYRQIGMFKDLMEHSETYQITIPGYEGDDVISALAEIYRKTEDVYIYSTDKDLRQFYGGSVTGMATPLKGYGGEFVDDKFVRLYKALVGDPSDNIKGIAGFGQKAFFECNKERIQDKFERGIFELDEQDHVATKVILWSKENTELLKTMWSIVGFFPIDLTALSNHMKPCQYNPAAVAETMKRFMLI